LAGAGRGAAWSGAAQFECAAKRRDKRQIAPVLRYNDFAGDNRNEEDWE
jgi:hypothetical protein